MGAAQAMTDERSLSLIRDRAAVIDVVLAAARALDVKDWVAYRGCFTDEIETDYSDLRGEPPQIVKADDFVALRRTALDRLKTLHLSANHLVTVDGDRALGRAYVRVVQGGGDWRRSFVLLQQDIAQ